MGALLEPLAHHPDLLAGVVILRLVLDRIGADVVDPEQRPEAGLDVDDPLAPGARLVRLALVQDVLQVHVHDV